MIALSLLLTVLSTKLYAQDIGLGFEIQRFRQDIEVATPILEDALTKMQSDYINVAPFTCPSSITSSTVYTYSVQNASDADSNTLANGSVDRIASGWVCNDQTFGGSSNTTNAQFVDIDPTVTDSTHAALQRFILQITFSSAANVSPSLQGKTVTFIAYGLGPEHLEIVSETATSSSVSQANQTQMGSIAGFNCVLPNVTNKSEIAGYIAAGSGHTAVNLWNYVDGGAFSSCKFA